MKNEKGRIIPRRPTTLGTPIGEGIGKNASQKPGQAPPTTFFALSSGGSPGVLVEGKTN
tara:strand:+ start:1280 stop:1456 length:177 start_codon:yes stop_codon:yes gene_type:complete